MLLELGIAIDACDNGGQTALHHAAGGHWSWICEALLQRGANVNLRDCWGQTPLHLANKTPDTKYDPDRNSWIDTVNVLLESKPDQTIVDDKGLTATDLVKASDNMFRKFYCGGDLDWTNLIYNGEEDPASVLRQFKVFLKTKFHFPKDPGALLKHCSPHEGDGYMLEAELP